MSSYLPMSTPFPIRHVGVEHAKRAAECGVPRIHWNTTDCGEEKTPRGIRRLRVRAMTSVTRRDGSTVPITRTEYELQITNMTFDEEPEDILDADLDEAQNANWRG